MQSIRFRHCRLISAVAAPRHPSSPSTCPPRACSRPHEITSQQQSVDDEAERPALFGGFVRRPQMIAYERTRSCGKCSGSETVECAGCGGAGRLPFGGYQPRNPVSARRVVGSKWTALQRTFGWRHFRVAQKRKEGGAAFVLMVATCDEGTQLWVNIQNLKDRSRWAAGWLQKRDMLAVQGEGPSGAECKACHGSGRLLCPLCSLAGEVVDL